MSFNTANTRNKRKLVAMVYGFASIIGGIPLVGAVRVGTILVALK